MNGDVLALALLRFEGASAVIEGRVRILPTPRWSRRHICRAASSGGSEAMWEVA